jgi:single-stranded DNA-binding protein
MSLYTLAAGVLVADPQQRESAKGSTYATAQMRVSTGEAEALLVSIVAFADAAQRLLEHGKGDSLAVSGRARLNSWTGRDGAEKHGLSLVAEQIASTRPQRRPDDAAPRRRASYTASRQPAAKPSSTPMHDDPVSDLWPG